MEIKNEGPYDVAVFECPGDVIRDVIHQGIDEANRKGKIVPEPLVVMPDGESKNRFRVYCPRGYNLAPFEGKIMRRMYESAQKTD